MQMKNMKWIVASAALLASGIAGAGEFSSTITATSDYDFRGVSLSAKDPALQASVDWAADNGFYVGAWASNIDYGSEFDGDIELDLYGGYAWETSGGLAFDVGGVWYTYPGSSSTSSKSKIEDYPELWAGISYGVFELKQWWAIDYGGGSDDGLYTEGNLSFELPANFTLGVHAGYNYGDAFDGFEYFDYAVSVGYTLGNFDLELKYTGTDLSGEDKIKDDVFNTEPRLIFSVSTTLPWGGE
jgi:uncharacterized protein (TIGR02001 family)